MFAFDTYVSVTSYNSSDDGTKELLNALSEEFSETYNKKEASLQTGITRISSNVQISAAIGTAALTASSAKA